MELAYGTLRIDRSICSTCARCIAICLQAVLSWNGMPTSAFEAGKIMLDRSRPLRGGSHLE
jgi:ferredoxin